MSKQLSTTSNKSDSMVNVIYAQINNNRFTITLTQNSSVKALVKILKHNDIIYHANDYGNVEKIGDIKYTLPTNHTQIYVTPGDVVLYHNNNIVMFYGNNLWSYTYIGKINNYSQEALRDLLAAGAGIISIKLSLA